MSSNIYGFGKFSTAKNLYTILTRNKTILLKHFNVEIGYVLSLGKSVKCIDVDTDILNAIDILESELGNATVQRHLTTFKTNFLMITRTSFCTLVTTGCSATFTRTCTTTYTLRVFYRTFSRFKIT